MADATEENFSQQGRPDKWQELAESTIKKRKKAGHWPGQILQVEGRLATSITTQYDNESAIIGSNLDYAAIHQLGGQAGKNKSVSIPARPYLKLTNDDLEDILEQTERYFAGAQSARKYSALAMRDRRPVRYRDRQVPVWRPWLQYR